MQMVWMHCNKIRSDKSKYLYKENFLKIFYKYSKSFKGGGGIAKKRTDFLAKMFLILIP